MPVIIDLTMPVFCLLLCIGCGICWFVRKRQNWKVRYWIIPIFLCYMLLLIQITLFPIIIYDEAVLNEMREGAGKYFTSYQFIPFASIKNYARPGAKVQLVGNIVLLAPLALFAEIFLCQRVKAWKVALAVSAVSFLIEVIQLITNMLTGYPCRVADVDDLILNTFGVVVTILLTRCVCKSRKIRNALRKALYN